jgi:DHA2 family multidrug resistance protein
MAPSFGLLVAFRILQGLSGGPIMPTSQTLLLYIFPKNKGAQALGLWSMTTVVAPIAGPLLGGNISDTIGWSWIFFINIPVAFGVAFGAWSMLMSHETQTRRVPVDYVGLGLLVVWVGALQIMLDKGKELEWFASTTIVVLAVTAAIGFVSFLIWELTSENPVVDLRVFRHRGFVVGVITLSLTFGTFFSSVVLIPLWLQTSIGYTATWAGYASSLNGVFAVVMSPIVARLLGRTDARGLVSFGVCWMAVIAFWRAHFASDANFWAIALPFLAQGFAMPFYFVSITSITLSSVEPRETASAAGLSNFLRTSSAAFATSIMTTAWENTATAKRAEMVGHLNNLSATTSALTAHGLTPEQAMGQVDRLVQVEATMLATNQMFLVMAVIFLFAASVIWLAPRSRRGGQVMADH